MTFFKRCPSCRGWCHKAVSVCGLCNTPFPQEEKEEPASLTMLDSRRLRAIYRMYEAAVQHGQPHSLAEVVAFFDDRPLGKGSVA